jgi:hypothetical protein
MARSRRGTAARIEGRVPVDDESRGIRLQQQPVLAAGVQRGRVADAGGADRAVDRTYLDVTVSVRQLFSDAIPQAHRTVCHLHDLNLIRFKLFDSISDTDV